MAYDIIELEKKAITILNEKNVIFIEELASHLGISKGTLYNLKLNELDTIKNLLDRNKENIKAGLRDKWYESDNATTQIVLYKLCATDEELKLLNPNQRNENINLNVNVEGDIKSMSETERLNEIDRIRKLLN